ncbi:hypothetical protein EYF80_014214 [Liparis tanakae]|uniref:Uncharacterized protein n=1 Tax=Liparis tanakae TaxID=230148 RepID=A0A4Z2IC32_9TELE|nr:hypothetical protein EYF80_014214 [Liparis tanakae]
MIQTFTIHQADGGREEEWAWHQQGHGIRPSQTDKLMVGRRRLTLPSAMAGQPSKVLGHLAAFTRQPYWLRTGHPYPTGFLEVESKCALDHKNSPLFDQRLKTIYKDGWRRGKMPVSGTARKSEFIVGPPEPGPFPGAQSPIGWVDACKPVKSTWRWAAKFLDRVTLCLTPRLKAELRQARPLLADKQRILSLSAHLSLSQPVLRMMNK